MVFSIFCGQKKNSKFFWKHSSVRTKKLHKIKLIFFFLILGKKKFNLNWIYLHKTLSLILGLWPTNSFLFHQYLFLGLRVPILSSFLTWNLTLRWIASWFLQKCKKILNKIHYVCSQPQKKEAKFTNSDAYGHSNTKLLQKLRLYSTKRIFRYIY